ncbi:MAG TPA: C40 family peptidase [Niabella sp.]|jgi:cell wall-associated NlpC family hydrolase|nr:C40 family peptidase [Niabella sp.]HRO85317.1 C40 family peptidase [Niabella sp.]
MKKWKFIIFFLLFCNFSRSQNFSDTSLIKYPEGQYWSIVSESLVSMYREPSHKSELISQALLGTPIKVIAKDKNWYQVQTPEGYKGWVNAPIKYINRKTLSDFNLKPRLIVTANNTFIYKEPKISAEITSEVIMGNLLFLDNPKKQKNFYKVSFADGRGGYIPAASVKTWDEWKKSIQLTGNSIENVGKKFVGLPYFWGGTSSRGLDCSGFTKTTYLMHGIILPRDAKEQYLTGVAIDSTDNFSKLQKGDLLFFGRKNRPDTTQYNIVHTGIYLQNRQFINADSKGITISSLDPNDKNYDEHNRKRYVIAKRILNSPENGTWSIFDHPWYNQ